MEKDNAQFDRPEPADRDRGERLRLAVYRKGRYQDLLIRSVLRSAWDHIIKRQEKHVE